MEYMLYNGELYHHGIKGQKWGVRRYQNPDGTLTDAGKKRYGTQEVFDTKQRYKAARKEYSKAFDNAYRHNHPYSLSKKKREATAARWEEAGDKAEALRNARKEYRLAKNSAKTAKAVNAIQKDIDSFKGLENGIFDKRGRMLLSADDVKTTLTGLEHVKQKALAKGKAKADKIIRSSYPLGQKPEVPYAWDEKLSKNIPNAWDEKPRRSKANI